jgi:hypothetical protein
MRLLLDPKAMEPILAPTPATWALMTVSLSSRSGDRDRTGGDRNPGQSGAMSCGCELPAPPAETDERPCSAGGLIYLHGAELWSLLLLSTCTTPWNTQTGDRRARVSGECSQTDLGEAEDA